MIRSALVKVAQGFVRMLAARRYPRIVLNRYHLGLDFPARSAFHDHYAKIFEATGAHLDDGEWKVEFLGRILWLPLRADHADLDWATALAICGHDIDVKTTYARLLASNAPPEVFLDAGANFGTHSLLLASHGVRTIAFEPNPACRAYPQAVCERNGLAIQWEAVGLGEARGEASLTYPTSETWLGSIVPDVVENLANHFPAVATERIQIRPLDDYIDSVEGKRVLLKIDVEGSEAQVLKGAANLIARSAPTIIFESNDPATRADLMRLLDDLRYAVFHLPPQSDSAARALEAGAFRSSSETNFIAWPRDRPF